MVFSSISFIFYFLPIVLVVYYLTSRKYKNLVLLISSLAFYFIGEEKLIIVFISSIIFNYLWAFAIDKYHNKASLVVGVVFNLGLLAYFKYANFFIGNLNNIFNINIKLLNITLPIGISFFTFQGISYLIDVYRKDTEVQKSLISFATYISFFPQLIAGPIVRYTDVEDDLRNRQDNSDDFVLGIKRFVLGLAKKIIIADSLALFISSLNEMVTKTVLSHILEAIAYTFQLYFDFSAYSDMAIGLGLFFGFHFLENFNYPLFATSITDFWRKWHISLSSWFKDYLYIPLGGSRVKPMRHIFNIMVVWLLTGFWHGANYNFIIWGLYFGIILIIEKYFLLNHLKRHKVVGHIYTFIIVVFGFVIFNHSDLNELITFITNMLGLNGLAFSNSETIYYLESNLVLLIISFIFASPLLKNLYGRIKNYRWTYYLEYTGLIIIFILSISYLVSASFSPFLYFRF